MNHDIYRDTDKVYRCTRCSRVSMSEKVLQGIPCHGQTVNDLRATEGSAPEKVTNDFDVSVGIEPAFPDIGTVWGCPPENAYYVWSNVRKKYEDCGVPSWVNLSTGEMRPGQMSFSGSGTHADVKTFTDYLTIPKEALARSASITVSLADFEWELKKALTNHLKDARAVPVDLPIVQWDDDPTTNQITASISVQVRYIPKRISIYL